MQFEQWVDIHLEKGRAAQTDFGILYEGDNNSLKLGVRLFENGQSHTVSGSVSGWAVLASGQTVSPFSETGSSGNEAWVIVPQSALYPGRLQVFLRVTDSGSFAVSLDAVGTVRRTSVGEVINPGTVIPNVDQLTALATAAQTLIDNWAVATTSETSTYLGIT